MANYTSDQFYLFGNYEPGKTIGRKGNDNANFNYPKNIAHPVNVGEKVDDRFVQRGFIRGIYPAVLGKKVVGGASTVKQRRLFFQFNPTTLDRTVSMNMSMLNPLLQDPTNLLSPVPGSSAFSFDMLFNRESEVVTGSYTTANGSRAKSSLISGSLENYGAGTQADDVSTLGVLADLYILDSIIGQSITPDMVDFLKSYWNNASNLSQKAYTANSGGASFSFNDTAFQTTVQKNYGNTAFLSPLPIRIVFSSLFMVEGFVEATSVQFIKFTRDYVPTICKVTLNVRALYIGFAREKAYLTDALETAVSDMIETQKKDELITKSMENLIKSPRLEFTPKDYYSNDVIRSTISFEANREDFSDEVIENLLLPTPGLTNTGSSETNFKDWWANNRYQYNVVWEGYLKSGVTKSFKQAVANDGITWSFDARFEINRNLDFSDPAAPSGGEKLVNASLKYKRMNGDKHSGSQTIADNANKKLFKEAGVFKGNTDVWYLAPARPKDVVIAASDKISFSIFVDITLNYTTSSGATSLTRSISKHHTFSASSTTDWAKVTSQNIMWEMYEKTGGQSGQTP